MARRTPLHVERIIEAAMAVADEGGLAKVSMRNVAAALGVEAMSLYHHLANKEALLDGLVDAVFAQIEVPDGSADWRAAMTDRAFSTRSVLLAHPWALGLIESRRRPGPALLAHHDGVLGVLRAGGFGVGLAAHAFSVLDAYVYGFVLTEVNLPFEAGETAEAFVEEIDEMLPADRYPHLVELIEVQVRGGGYAYGNEFGAGLDLILDGLAQRLAAG